MASLGVVMDVSIRFPASRYVAWHSLALLKLIGDFYVDSVGIPPEVQPVSQTSVF